MRNFKKQTMRLLLFILLTSFVSCNGQTDNSKISNEISSIVKQISKENTVTGSAVGYAGTKPKQWDRFVKLQKKATDKELILLTEHKNEAVRCYAFQALVMRNNEKCFEILKAHLTDKKYVETFLGCIMSEERVGDYFIQCVWPPYDKNSFTLSDQQKIELDSIIFFDDEIKLSFKDGILKRLKPEPIYYNRIREIVIEEDNLKALVALAKYQNPNDIPIIKKFFNDEENQYWAIYAVREYPDSSFYQDLLSVFEQDWSNKYYDYPRWRILYQTLAQYPTNKTMELFERTIKKGDRFRKQTLGKYLMIAITKYPNERYEQIKNEIKLDEIHMDEISQEIDVED